MKTSKKWRKPLFRQPSRRPPAQPKVPTRPFASASPPALERLPGGAGRMGAAMRGAAAFWGRGQRPRPQNAAAPRMSAPAFLRPQGNRRIADGCTPARGSRLPLGARRGGGGALRALKSGSRRLCLRFPLTGCRKTSGGPGAAMQFAKVALRRPVGPSWRSLARWASASLLPPLAALGFAPRRL